MFDRQGRRLGDLAAEEGPVESGSSSGRVGGLGVPDARFRITLSTEPLPVAQPSAGGDLQNGHTAAAGRSGAMAEVGDHALHVGMDLRKAFERSLDLGHGRTQMGHRVHHFHLYSRVRIGRRGVQQVGHSDEPVGLVAGQSHGGSPV